MDFVNQSRGSICTLYPPSMGDIPFQRILTPPTDSYPYNHQSSHSGTTFVDHISMTDDSSMFYPSRTLKSVLSGDVPAEYAHLASGRIDCRHDAVSPHHSLVTPPHDAEEQTEPMDLSCKTPSPKPRLNNVVIYSDQAPSMLRSLLSMGKRQDDDRSGSSSPDLSQIQPCTRVTLAKKNMFPVSSRVSDWLVKIVQFSKSIPEFLGLSHNDKVTLLLNSWSRSLLLYMAESNFQFVVAPTHDTNDNVTPSPEEPTMKSVEEIQNFIRKCQTMNMDSKEYALLRMLVLFHSGCSGIERQDLVEQIHSRIQELMRQHVQATRPDDPLHYSKLLMTLPTLFGVNCTMTKRIFCQNLQESMDVLLEELLNKL